MAVILARFAGILQSVVITVTNVLKFLFYKNCVFNVISFCSMKLNQRTLLSTPPPKKKCGNNSPLLHPVPFPYYDTDIEKVETIKKVHQHIPNI
jgi:hypothetical protein